MTLTIRPIQTQDLAALTDMINATIAKGGTTAFEDPFTPESFDAEFRSSDEVAHSLAAIHAEHGPVGHQTLYWYSPKDPTELGIATFTDQRLPIRGVGRALMAATKAAARAMGCATIHAKIRADNGPGLAYYTGQGFVRYGVDPAIPLQDGTPIDRVLTRCHLAKTPD